MTNLFPKKVRKEIPRLYEDRTIGRKILEKVPFVRKRRDEKVKELIEKADKFALEESKYEYVVDKTIEEFRKFLSGTEEKKIEELLKGIKDVDTNKEVIKYLKKLRVPLRKIRFILHKTIRLDDESLETLGKLAKLIDDYKRTNPKPNYIFKTFENLCKNRYKERDSLRKFLWDIRKSIDAMLRIVERSIESTEEFDYETVLRDLRAEKEELHKIVKSELAAYGIEVDLFKDDVGLEQLDSYLKRYSKDKSFLGKETRLAKRSYLIKRLTRVILISATAYQLTVPASLSFFASWNFPFATKADMHPEIQQMMKHEIIHFKSKSGFPLVGWFFDNPSTDKTIVMCHGLNMNKSYFMELVDIFSKGYDVFVFDFAGYGETEYKTFNSLSYSETDDLYGALKYLSERGIKEVALYGFSMGATVCVNVAADPPPNIRINALITQGCFSDLDQLTTDAARGLFLLPPMEWTLKRAMESMGGYRMKDIQPGKKMKKVKCPVLIINASGDFLVTTKNVKDLYNNAPKGKRELYFCDGDHWRYSEEEVGIRSMEFLSKRF